MRRSAATIAFAFALCSCGSDRIATGPSGTETGSAVQARLRMPDGGVAAGARVVVRLEGAENTPAGTVSGVADDSGLAEFRLGNGDWTLEARSAGVAVRRAFRIERSDTVGVVKLPTDTLKKMSSLALCIDRAETNAEFALAGLGRRSSTGADGCARWDSLPSGAQGVRSADSVRNWQVVLEPGRSDSFFQVAGRRGAWFREGRSVAWSGRTGFPMLVDLPSDATDSVPEEWVGPDGSELPAIPVWSRPDGGLRAWIRPTMVGAWVSRRRVHGPGSGRSPFDDGTPVGIWSVSSVGGSSAPVDSLEDLSGRGKALTVSSPRVPGYDSAQGWFLESGSVGPLAILDSTRGPSSGAFSFLVHSALATGVSSVSLLDWSKSDALVGVRIDLLASGLHLVAPGIDTSFAILQTSRYHAIALTWDGSALRLGLDGRERLNATTDLRERASWRQPRIGVGAGLRVTQILTARSAIDPGPLSNPPTPSGR